MALARGYAASIPIIIRSLASSIAFVPDEKYLPYRLDDSVLHTLDAGEHHQVRTYHLQWSGPMRKDLENVEILGKLTMMKCLEHFNVEKSKSTVLPEMQHLAPASQHRRKNILLITTERDADPVHNTGNSLVMFSRTSSNFKALLTQ